MVMHVSLLALTTLAPALCKNRVWFSLQGTSGGWNLLLAAIAVVAITVLVMPRLTRA